MDITPPSYPSPETWEHATPKQKERVERSFVQLKKRQVPVYHGPLFGDDDAEANIQTPQNVARRTLVLWSVELRAEGLPIEEVREILDTLELWESVSPEELRFLNEESPSPDECQQLIWRLESIWVLMWALGYIEELDWPSSMCNVSQLANMLSTYEGDPEFIASATLRPDSELLDAHDLIRRIRWAVINTYYHGEGILPVGLDWTGTPDFVECEMSVAGRVAQERHYVLSWLVNYPECHDWDNVDTPT